MVASLEQMWMCVCARFAVPLTLLKHVVVIITISVARSYENEQLCIF